MYIFEHKMIMEKKIGRSIYPWEVVHHINHDRTDNRPDNLWLCTRQIHDMIHAKEKAYYIKRDLRGRFI